jgi:hypothetical protein
MTWDCSDISVALPSNDTMFIIILTIAFKVIVAAAKLYNNTTRLLYRLNQEKSR